MHFIRNPGGVRFGSAELYDVLELCFSEPGAESIVDCVAVGQKISDGTDERVILFVKLPPGNTLSVDLEQRIKIEIRNRRSPRHVPARVCRSLSHVASTVLNNHIVDYPGRRYTLHIKW